MGRQGIANHSDVEKLGPDNLGFISRVRSRLLGVLLSMYIVVWCLFHGCHSCVGNVLCVLENFRWTLSDAEPQPQQFFSGVATIANCWRATGIARKVSARASDLNADPHKPYVSAPGRCLKQRWGSLYKVLVQIISALPLLGTIFSALFPGGGDIQRTARRRPGAAEEDDFRERQSTYRRNAVASLHNKRFLISLHCAAPVLERFEEFLNWAQKQISEVNKKKREAIHAGGVYIGPTLLSEFVNSKLDTLNTKWDYLLSDESMHEVWSGVWACGVTDEPSLLDDVFRLINTLVLVGVASWAFRFQFRGASLPWLLLRMLESPSHVDCAIRRTVVFAWHYY